MSHTPGPWHAKDLHVYSGEDHSDKGIRDNSITQGGCGCCHSWYEGVHKIEDARLIAAAPDLLAALESAEMLIAFDYDHGIDNGYWPTVSPVLRQIRAAIKKAKGEA